MVQMLFRLIDGKVKKLLGNQREGGKKRKRLRNRRAERKKKKNREEYLGEKNIEMRQCIS